MSDPHGPRSTGITGSGWARGARAAAAAAEHYCRAVMVRVAMRSIHSVSSLDVSRCWPPLIGQRPTSGSAAAGDSPPCALRSSPGAYCCRPPGTRSPALPSPGPDHARAPPWNLRSAQVYGVGWGRGGPRLLAPACIHSRDRPARPKAGAGPPGAARHGPQAATFPRGCAREAKTCSGRALACTARAGQQSRWR